MHLLPYGSWTSHLPPLWWASIQQPREPPVVMVLWEVNPCPSLSPIRAESKIQLLVLVDMRPTKNQLEQIRGWDQLPTKLIDLLSQQLIFLSTELPKHDESVPENGQRTYILCPHLHSPPRFWHFRAI